jgi:hypothetical protein
MSNDTNEDLLSEESRRICERARRCLANAQALMLRLDRLDLEWARGSNQFVRHIPTGNRKIMEAQPR